MIARSMVVAAVSAVVALSSGCIVPRTAGYGMTAMPVGAGGADVGLSVGGYYQQESSAQPAGGGTTTTTSRQTQLPSFEANAQYGLSDQLGLNLHASQVGLQPGVKITVLRDPVTLSVVPQIGGGFVTNGGSATTVIGGTTTTTDRNGGSSFTFLGGVRALVTVPMGLYAGLGYDFQYVSQSTTTVGGGGTTTTTTNYQQAHNVGGAIGYELRLGGLALRPELALLFTPVAKNQSNNGNTTTDIPDSSGLFIYPNITIAAVSSSSHK